METRARYIFVGVFTLVLLMAGFGFTLWLAKVQVNRTYAQYDIVFDTVAGLGQASVVQYNGVAVGKVLTIDLDRDTPDLVRVRIEIYASTPVRADTMATLASQGVTGVSFVALAGGSADSDRLRAVPPADVPLIASQPSAIQGMITDAPDLLAESILLMQDIRAFTTPENGEAITQILKNVETATARIDAMATRTEAVMTSAQATLARVDSALAKAETALTRANSVMSDDVPGLVQSLNTAIDKVGRSATALEEFTRQGLPQFGALGREARDLVSEISTLVRRIGSDPGRFLLGNQTPSYRN